MAHSGSGKALSMVSAVIGIGAAFFALTVPAGVWNYSAEGASLLVGAVAGVVAAGLAIVARQREESALNSFGIVLGGIALAVGAAMLLLGGYNIEFG